jgi:hypothetical protein
VSPWEIHFFLKAEIAAYTNLQWAKTWAKARWACRRRCVVTPAKLTGPRHELCTWGEPTRPGVGSLSRKRYTQYVEQIRKGHSCVPWHARSLGNRLAATATASTRGNQVKTGRRPIMEEMP